MLWRYEGGLKKTTRMVFERNGQNNCNYGIERKRMKYSLPKKQCTKFSNKKSSVFFPVNLLENLHASTYTIYNYIYKIKKNPSPFSILHRKVLRDLWDFPIVHNLRNFLWFIFCNRIRIGRFFHPSTSFWYNVHNKLFTIVVPML